MTATTPENQARINSMLESLSDRLSDLFCRWQDEKEYEDINDYGKHIRKLLPEGFVLERMKKVPFGFVFSIGTDAKYEVFVNSRQMGWRRLNHRRV